MARRDLSRANILYWETIVWVILIGWACEIINFTVDFILVLSFHTKGLYFGKKAKFYQDSMFALKITIYAVY